MLDDGGFERVKQMAAKLLSELDKKSFIDEVALGAVGQDEPSSIDVR